MVWPSMMTGAASAGRLPLVVPAAPPLPGEELGDAKATARLALPVRRYGPVRKLIQYFVALAAMAS